HARQRQQDAGTRTAVARLRHDVDRPVTGDLVPSLRLALGRHHDDDVLGLAPAQRPGDGPLQERPATVNHRKLLWALFAVQRAGEAAKADTLAACQDDGPQIAARDFAHVSAYSWEKSGNADATTMPRGCTERWLTGPGRLP